MGPRPPAAPPRLELLETCWSLVGPTGKTISCGIYAVARPGVEVRSGYSVDDFAKTHRVPGHRQRARARGRVEAGGDR